MADASLIKKIYRVFSWVSLIGLVLVILLVLRKSAPPDVPYDPSAAKRVEQKFAAAGEAKAAGQPAEVQMDRTELNSYLAQNLQLEGSGSAPAAPAANPAAALPIANGASPNPS
ncbi:MAG: hypothetical protein ACRD3S_17275, partial [Terracidiphilus sp.]